MELAKENEILAGKYRVERVLGAGGMGVVVLATHLQLEQSVALKFLQPEALKRPALVARFAREARALARLTTEHVARVIDVGTLDTGAPYIVMEYLDGEDLAALLDRRGRLPVPEVASYLLQACEAIAEAHAARIVHRDLKPANLFLARRRDGSEIVKVLDFGIAKALDDDTALTKTASGLGSAHYMAPEQMRDAKGCDERADLWAFGVILFELTTGAVPFEGSSVHEVVAAVIEQRRHKLRDLLPTAPPALDALVERCLQVDPAKRIASVVELAEGLAALVDDPDARTSLAKVRRTLGRPSAPHSGATGPGSEVPSREEIANAATVEFPPSVGSGEAPLAGVASPTLPASGSMPPGSRARLGLGAAALGLAGLAGLALVVAYGARPSRDAVALPSAAAPSLTVSVPVALPAPPSAVALPASPSALPSTATAATAASAQAVKRPPMLANAKTAPAPSTPIPTPAPAPTVTVVPPMGLK